TPHITVGGTTPTHVAGFAGQTFDATVVGSDHPPFCRTHKCPGHGGVSLARFCTNTMHGETQDVKFAGKGQLFRIIVLDVRDKRSSSTSSRACRATPLPARKDVHDLPPPRAADARRPALSRVGRLRRRADSNRCTRLCRPLPNHSATAPGAIVAAFRPPPSHR